ncbi:DUF4446 family protein [Desulfosporosinus fructosivorans]|uniref:DUF4446 family protein n=1 Tax=Desulfosporosinus fructosivorans TaxID=2018669 RepID=A0A4Z0R3I9_9FIRM|nr:DUF4446 family protein [Desulfosporosinus fructosivorans]TGE36703.1 DUF4446 family protein [Desulfosporosinus fructosivorans]
MPLHWWGICALALLLVIAFIINILFYRRLNRRMKLFESSSITLQTFMSGHQLDTLLQENIQKLIDQEQEINRIDTRLSKAEIKLRASVDRAELIRFRAFENVGSDLSFAFALLNQEGSGVVLSSIHNREEARVYAKPVKEGISTYSLTGEEKEVIDRAMLGQKI